MNLAIEDRTSVFTLRDADGRAVAQCLRHDDAREIVRRVNAHDALVAAAKEAVHVIGGCYGVDSAAYHAIDRLAAVLHELDHDAP